MRREDEDGKIVSDTDVGRALDLDAGFAPLQRARWYKRVQAWVLSHRSRRYDAMVAGRKRELLAPLEGTVLEIGPGAGANLQFFGRGVRLIGVEPNPYAHARLAAEAARRGVEAEVKLGTAERLPLPDRSVDAVIATLVLCTVRDPAATLREVRRVLRPGGRFVFMEHVAAPPQTGTRTAQRLIRPLWSFLGDGCRPDRDTARTIEQAGFARVQLDPFRLPIPIVGPHLCGVAWAP
jgi:SAM-dependent methyltransferase